MTKYIDIEKAKAAMTAAFKADVEMYGVAIVECFDAERANEILDTLPAANVRLPVFKVEQGIYTKLASVLVECAFETSGCGLCWRSDREGCSHTRLLTTAADAIKRLLREETP